MWKSVDGAKRWTATGVEIAERRVDAIAVDPVNADIVYAGIDRDVAKSVDGGRTWQVATTAPYAGTQQDGVWKSADRGATRAASNNGLGKANVQALLLDGSGTLYAATFKQGVYRSANRGATWTRVGGEPPHPDAIALALDPSGPGRLLVGMGGGAVWRLEIAPGEAK